MISRKRIQAMMYRYFINMRHSYDRMSDMFYWPAVDLLLWGLTGLYFAKLMPGNSNAISIILTGLVFWIVIWRAQYEITTNLLVEMWDQNLLNIFASPITIQEWIIGITLFGLGKMIISLSFSAVLAYILYHYSILVFGYYLIPLIASLVLTGWAAGFFVAGFIIRYGQKIQTLAWTGVVMLAPFSALYYPISILPKWAQHISLAVPSRYVFEGLREILSTGKLSSDKLIMSFLLNGVYLVFSIGFFVMMFHRSKQKGLGRLI